jgi:hypothetical protein
LSVPSLSLSNVAETLRLLKMTEVADPQVAKAMLAEQRKQRKLPPQDRTHRKIEK